jgi:2-polyprenyl-6-methoxyphenol hydroxylase-like FAD-dependent oxidoreductase
MTKHDVDVLVVGAGPTGLTLALELRRHGVSCRVVDQNEGPSAWSKAQIVHARTLEVFEDMGVVEPLIARGRAVHGFNVYDPGELKRILNFALHGVDSPFPFVLSVPQRDTELVLAAAAAERGLTIERNVRLARFEQDAEGVASVLVAGDREEAVRSRWIVGCDGAHSTVRAGLGISFEGHTYEQKIIQADVRVELPLAIHDDEVAAFLSAKGLLALFPLPGERRFRMLVPAPAEQDLEPTLETFERYLAELGPSGAKVDDPVWMVGFRVHCKMVSRYRERHAFLAGDAAHIHSPAGGQGMNTGIQDAYNLAWKLALVHRGRGKDVLLDSYQAERLPVAASVLRATDQAMQRGFRVARVRSPLLIDLAQRMFGFVGSLGFVQERVSRGISMLEVAYPESPIVAQDRHSMLDAHVLADRRTEEPSVRDWMAFGDGPAPGARALDASFDPERDDATRVFDLLRGVQHTLLLFDGAAATGEGYRGLESIAARVTARYGEAVAVHVIVPARARPDALGAAVSVQLDPEGAVHQRYGARSECLYLVRPDGYVAYRCQPADGDKLFAYLERVLA